MSCQKLVVILENKVIERLMLLKIVNEKWTPRFRLFNEKKIGKIPKIFEVEN